MSRSDFKQGVIEGKYISVVWSVDTNTFNLKTEKSFPKNLYNIHFS